MASPTATVRQQQRDWATSYGIDVDRAGYTQCLQDNLFQPLSQCTEEDFSRGDGGELGLNGERAKMQALHSSSALACNFFDYWRGRETLALADALDVPGPLCSIQFEQKRPTGLRGKAPNLDVVIRPATGTHLAIESKFLEPYKAVKIGGFKGKYFEGPGVVVGHWKSRCLNSCQELAAAIHSGSKRYRWLNAEQLLKHILGLSRTGDEWTLMYLWYEVPGRQSTEHRAEVAEFGKLVQADGVLFTSLSYQELFRRLEGVVGDPHGEFTEYMRRRYFAEEVER